MSETSTETMTASKTDFRQLQHPIGNKPQLLDSAEFQQQALDELREILSKFSDQVDQLSDDSCPTAQAKRGRRTQAFLTIACPNARFLGMTRDQLNPKSLGAIQTIEDMQRQISEEAGEIGKEITRYFERTGNRNTAVSLWRRPKWRNRCRSWPRE